MEQQHEQTDKVEFKFFDKPFIDNGPIPLIEVTGTLETRIDELRKCMESEGFVLNNDEIIKTLDIYLRIIGLDRNVNTEKGLAALYSLCGLIQFSDLSDMNEDKLNKCRTAFRNVNALSDSDKRFTDERIDYIAEHIDIIFKEYSIFMNELFIVIQSTVNYNPRLANYHTLFKTSTENTMFMVSGNYISDIEDFAYDIVSNVICSRSPENVAIIVNSFRKESQEKLKAGMNKESKNGQN